MFSRKVFNPLPSSPVSASIDVHPLRAVQWLGESLVLLRRRNFECVVSSPNIQERGTIFQESWVPDLEIGQGRSLNYNRGYGTAVMYGA